MVRFRDNGRRRRVWHPPRRCESCHAPPGRLVRAAAPALVAAALALAAIPTLPAAIPAAATAGPRRGARLPGLRHERLPQLARDGRRDLQAQQDHPDIVRCPLDRQELPGPRHLDGQGQRQRRRRRGRARGPHRRPPPRPRAPHDRAGARPAPLADRRLRLRRHRHPPRRQPRDLHHLRAQPGRDALRPHRQTPYRAWRKNRQLEPRRRSRSTPTSTATTATSGPAAAARPGSTGPASPTAARRPFSAPETRALRDFVDSRVVDGVQQIRTHITLHTNGELILWPYGYTKTNIPPDMTDARPRGVRRRSGDAMAARNGYTAEQSSRPVHHRRRPDRLDVRPPPDLLVHLRAVPGRDADGLGRPLPARRADRGPDRPQPVARSCYLIDRAACPYAAVGARRRRQQLRAAVRRLRDRPRLERDRDGADTATAGRWVRANPEATDRRGRQAAGHGRTRAAGAGDRRRAGGAANANDVDGGDDDDPQPRDPPRPPTRPTSARSRSATTFAHDANATDGRLAPGASSRPRTATGPRSWSSEAGDGETGDADWRPAPVDIDAWAGQTIRVIVEAVDGGADNLVEAAVDDVRIRRQ